MDWVILEVFSNHNMNPNIPSFTGVWPWPWLEGEDTQNVIFHPCFVWKEAQPRGTVGSQLGLTPCPGHPQPGREQ